MRLAVFDCETTGLPDQNKLARIVEVGVVVLEWETAWTRVAEWHSLARPRRSYYDSPEFEEALTISKLTVDQIEGCPPDWVVATVLERWLVDHQVTHHTSFNRRFDFHGVMLENATWLRRWCKVTFPAPCLMYRTQQHIQRSAGGNPPVPSLVDALAWFELPAVGPAHTALADARNAAQLVPHLFPQGPRGWTPPPGWDPEWAEFVSGSPTTAPRGEIGRQDGLEPLFAAVRTSYNALGGEPGQEMLARYARNELGEPECIHLERILPLRPDLRLTIKQHQIASGGEGA